MTDHRWEIMLEQTAMGTSWVIFCSRCNESAASASLPSFWKEIRHPGQDRPERVTAMPDAAIALLQGAFRALEVMRAGAAHATGCRGDDR